MSNWGSPRRVPPAFIGGAAQGCRLVLWSTWEDLGEPDRPTTTAYE